MVERKLGWLIIIGIPLFIIGFFLPDYTLVGTLGFALLAGCWITLIIIQAKQKEWVWFGFSIIFPFISYFWFFLRFR